MSEGFRANIKVYHVNDEERCLKFVNESGYLITSEDKYWLGFGMYFWDNNSNANYWMKQKIKKNPKGKYIKVSANIFIDEEILLDLTDEKTLEGLEKLWSLYCEKKKENTSQPLGIKINKIFDFFDDMKSVKALKAIGDYDIQNKKKSSFIYCGRGYYGPQITNNLKNIYCARNFDIVVNRKELTL